jgi:hypothetical protein
MIFIISIDMQTLAFGIVFSVPVNIWDFFAPCLTTQVGLQFVKVYPNITVSVGRVGTSMTNIYLL